MRLATVRDDLEMLPGASERWLPYLASWLRAPHRRATDSLSIDHHEPL